MSDVIAPIMARFTNFSMAGDGLPEIESLRYLDFESGFPDPRPEQRLALVLVESRLLAPGGNATLRGTLVERLRRLKTDLRAEGRWVCLNPLGRNCHKTCSLYRLD